MAAPETVIWSMDRHTQAKHEILRRYWGAWFPILINRFGQARIIDGFAGPGEYESGEIGSPLIALQALLTHPDKAVQNAIRKETIELIFIERDPKRSQHLQQLLEQQKQEPDYPPGLQPRIIIGTFVDEMTKQLVIMERQRNRGNAIPTFVFIDPFGYSQTPLNIITRIMSLPMCEVLINFMAEEINRFLEVDYRTKERHYDDLFGTQQWRQIAQQAANPAERRRLQHDLYSHQLHDVAGAKYVRSFRMRNKHNTTDYFLFFCTNNSRGMDEMKRAMWKVDQTGNFEFSDFSNPYQPLLLTEPNYADLQDRLVKHFKGKIVSVEDIAEYVRAETPYYIYKLEALRPLELAAPPKIRVVNPSPKRRKGTFSDSDMLIEFL
jgi:three-Cys-motif partner protein